MANIEIWQPRYSTNSVLIAQYKVEPCNYITFTKAKHLQGMTFYIDGDNVRSCPLVTNGRIKCYDVPFDLLQRCV